MRGRVAQVPLLRPGIGGIHRKHGLIPTNAGGYGRASADLNPGAGNNIPVAMPTFGSDRFQIDASDTTMFLSMQMVENYRSEPRLLGACN